MNIFAKNNQKLKTEDAYAILVDFDPEVHQHTDFICRPKPGKKSKKWLIKKINIFDY